MRSDSIVGVTGDTDATQSVYEFLINELCEDDPSACRKIWNTVSICGVEFVQSVYTEAVTVQEHGGMLTDDGSRRRTLGGIFFKIAKLRMTADQRWWIFGIYETGNGQPSQSSYSLIQPMEWDERKPTLLESAKRVGEVSKVKVSITGRPGKITEKGDCIITLIRDTKQPPSLPKGLPQPPSGTVYGIYIGRKQWTEAIKQALRDPTDELIIDGYLAFDKPMGLVCVFAQSVSTKSIKRAVQEKQKAAP